MNIHEGNNHNVKLKRFAHLHQCNKTMEIFHPCSNLPVFSAFLSQVVLRTSWFYSTSTSVVPSFQQPASGDQPEKHKNAK